MVGMVGRYDVIINFISVGKKNKLHKNRLHVYNNGRNRLTANVFIKVRTGTSRIRDYKLVLKYIIFEIFNYFTTKYTKIF
jgi:hypothetical protein